MDATVRKVVEMLASEQPGLAAAAARVLAELKPKEPQAVDALAAALASADYVLRREALEALGAIGARRAAAAIASLLEEPGDLAARAEAILVEMGRGVLAPLEKLLSGPGASARLRKALTLTIARIPAPVEASRLVECLERSDPRLIDAACLSLEHQAPEMSAPERKQLVSALAKFLAKSGRESDLSPLSAALRMLGALDHASAAAVVFPWAEPTHGPWARSSALRALKPLGPHLDPERHVVPLLAYLEEPDYERIVEPAIEVLYPRPLPARAARALEKLTASPHPSVRKFAIEKLEAIGPKWLVPRLLEMLDRDPASREKAVEVLARIPGGTAAAAKELEGAASPERARALARVLAVDPGAASAAVWEKLFKRALALAGEDDDGLSGALLEIARDLAPQAVCGLCVEEAARAKRAKRWGDAVRVLRWAKGLAGFDREARFALAVCELRGSRRDVAKAARLTDPCLAHFQALAHDGDFGLVERIRKEKPPLSPEETFYLGFHFSEGTGPEKGLGASLLAEVVKKSRGSKLGKAARNKIKAEGLEGTGGEDIEG